VQLLQPADLADAAADEVQRVQVSQPAGGRCLGYNSGDSSAFHVLYKKQRCTDEVQCVQVSQAAGGRTAQGTSMGLWVLFPCLEKQWCTDERSKQYCG
jgi:hypothetical protein